MGGYDNLGIRYRVDIYSDTLRGTTVDTNVGVSEFLPKNLELCEVWSV